MSASPQELGCPRSESWSTTVPVLVVDVVSSNTRTDDMVRKSGEYAEAGSVHYWPVDREHGTLTALRNNGHGPDITVELREGHPVGSVQVGDHGTVELALTILLAP